MKAASLTLSSDGSQLVYTNLNDTIAYPPTIQVWHEGASQFRPCPWEFTAAQAPKARAHFDHFPAHCEFSPDQKTVVGVYMEHFRSPIRYFVGGWDAKTGSLLWYFDGLRKFAPNGLFLAPQGKHLAVCEWESRKVTLFDLTRPHPTSDSSRPLACNFPIESVLPVAALSVAWAPDGHTLAIYTGPDIEFWDTVKKARTVHRTKGIPSSGASRLMQWSPDGRFLATSDTVSFALWDVSTRTWNYRSYNGISNHGTFSLAWMPDSRSFWIGGERQTDPPEGVQQWSAPDLKLLKKLPVNGPVAVSSDGKTLATRSIASKGRDGVWLWNIG